VGVRANGEAESTGKPEVSNLEAVGGGIDEEVLWFEVTVEDAMGVAVGNSGTYLEEEGFDGVGIGGELRVGVKVLLEVNVEVFKHKKQPAASIDDIKQLHHVLMFELFQQSDLS